MKNRRIKNRVAVAAFAVMGMLVLPLGATDITELVESAKQNSAQFDSIELSYTQSMNNYKLQNGSEGTEILLKVGESDVIKGGSYYYPAASLSVTLPEFVDGLDITASASVDSENVAGTKIGDTPVCTVGAGISYSNDNILDRSADTTKTKTLLQTQLNYEKSVLQFENSVIEDVVSIMQLENQIKQSTTTYERSYKSFTSNIALGELTEGSLNYIKEKMEVDKLKTSLDSSIERLENLKEQFLHTYGIEYETVEVETEADLTFDSSADGNTTVYLAYIDMTEAKEELDRATGNSSALSLYGGLDAGYTFNGTGSGSGTASGFNAKISGGASYSTGNFKVGLSASTKATLSGFSDPEVSVSGSWGKDSSLDIEISNLNIEYLKAQYTYNDSLYSYKSESKELESSISSNKIEKQTLELQLNYDTQVLNANKTLYEKGLCTLNEVEDAEAAVESDKLDLTVLELEGLVLQNQIKIQQL